MCSRNLELLGPGAAEIDAQIGGVGRPFGQVRVQVEQSRQAGAQPAIETATPRTASRENRRLFGTYDTFDKGDGGVFHPTP
jgi:hypothetical protein